MRSLQVGLAWLGAAALGGGVLLVGACARPGSPAGGPRDFIPPMVTSTWPDTFATIEPTRDPVKIVFSERISERPTQGSLDNAVLVSPVTGDHRVKHTRSGLEIEVIGGFQPNLVYRVRILPIVKDLFTNPMEGPFELVFSTGAEYETNVIAGVAEDRLTGEVVRGARVEARGRGEDDPPVYMATSDSSGVFALRYLPAASYDISLFEDINRNGEADFAERQGVAEGILGQQPPLADTIILRGLKLLRPDTTPARLIRVEAYDSLLVRFAFDDFLDAEGPLDPVQVQVQIAPEEGPGPNVDEFLWPRQVDSIRAVADSIAAEERRVAMVDSLQLVVDSLDQIYQEMEAAGDSLGIDTLGANLGRMRDRMAPPEPPEEPEPEAAQESPPILPQQEFFVLLTSPLDPDRLFQASVAGVVNINGLGGGGGEASFSWEPPEPPPEERPDTAAVADTAGVPPDTAGVRPDTAGVPPDTSGVPPDTSGVPPDTSRVPPDTSAVPSSAGRSVIRSSARTSIPNGPIRPSARTWIPDRPLRRRP